MPFRGRTLLHQLSRLYGRWSFGRRTRRERNSQRLQSWDFPVKRFFFGGSLFLSREDYPLIGKTISRREKTIPCRRRLSPCRRRLSPAGEDYPPTEKSIPC